MEIIGKRVPKKYWQAGWSLIDQVIVSIANFLSILILARSMSAAHFGVFMLAHTGLLLMTSLQNALITQPHNVLGARREGWAYGQFTAGLALAQLLGSFLLGLLLAIIGISIRHFYSMTTGDVIFVLAIAAVPWMAQEFVRRVLYTRSASRSAALNDFVSYGLQLTGVIWLAYFSATRGPSPQAALLVFGGSSLVAATLGIWQLREHIFLPVGNGRYLKALTYGWAEAWQFGKWLVSQQALSWFGGSGHGWLLAAIVGPEKFGMYRAAYQIVNVLNPLRQASMNYLPPRASRTLARHGVLGLERWVDKTTFALVAPFSVCALIIALAAQPLLSFAYGEKYAGMGLQWVVILGALAYLINFARTAKEYAVLAMGGAKALFVRTILSTVLVLTLGVLLIYLFGIVGALLSELSIAVVLLIITQWIYAGQKALPEGHDASDTNSPTMQPKIVHS